MAEILKEVYRIVLFSIVLFQRENVNMRRHQKKDMDAMRRGNAMRQWTAAGCRKKTTGKTYAGQECWSVENKLR